MADLSLFEIEKYVSCPMYYYYSTGERSHMSYNTCLSNSYTQYLLLVGHDKSPNHNDLRDLFNAAFSRYISEVSLSADQVDKLAKRAIGDLERFYNKFGRLNSNQIKHVNNPYKISIAVDGNTISVGSATNLVFVDGGVGATAKHFHIVGFYNNLYDPFMEMKAIFDVAEFRRIWSMAKGEPPERDYTYFPISKTGNVRPMTMTMPRAEEFKACLERARSRLVNIIRGMSQNIIYCRHSHHCQSCKYAPLCRLI